jgi:hypothetical protein
VLMSNSYKIAQADKSSKEANKMVLFSLFIN